MEESKVNLPPEAFYTLNASTISIVDRNKIARYLWKFSTQPNHETSLLNWITTTISSQNNHNDVQLLWTTLADFLNSEEIEKYFNIQNKDYKITKAFCEVYLDTVVETSNSDRLCDLLDIGRSLAYNNKISSGFKNKFLHNVKLISVWCVALDGLLQKHETSDRKLCQNVIDFLKKILAKLRDYFHDQKIENCFIFLEHCLTPMTRLHTRFTKENITDDALIDLMEQVMKRRIFSKNSCKLYVKSQKNCDGPSVPTSGEAEAKVKETNKYNPDLDIIWTKIKLLTEESANIVTIYRLYLESLKKVGTFKFFIKLLSLLDVKNGHHDTLSSLLKLNLQHKLYQPTVDKCLADEQRNFYVELVENVSMSSCSKDWAECLVTLANIDHTIIQRKLDFILKTLFSFLLANKIKGCDWLQNFFNLIADVFNKIRQPLTFLKSYIKCLREYVTESDLHGNGHSYIILSEIFSHSMTSQCMSLCSHSTALDMWETILNEIKSDMPDTKQEMTAAVKTPLSKVSSGKKHKLPLEGGIDSKRKKGETLPDILLHCLLILLNKVTGEIHLLDIQRQVLAHDRLKRLLQVQQDLTLNLRPFVRDSEHNLICSFTQLLIRNGQCEMLLEKYSYEQNNGETCQSLVEFKDWEIANGGKLSHCASYYERKYLCYKIEMLTRKTEETREDSAGSEDVSKKALHENLSKFIDSMSDLKQSRSTWDGFPECITSSKILGVATLYLLKSSFQTIARVADSDGMEKIAQVIFNLHDGKKKESEPKNDSFSMTSILDEILYSQSFSESRNLHSSILKIILKNAKENCKKLKSFKKIIKFAEKCMLPSADYDFADLRPLVVSIFEKDKDLSALNGVFNRAIEILSFLPLNFLPLNEVYASLIIVACTLATARLDVDLQGKCVKVAQTFLAVRSSEKYRMIFPLDVIMPYVTSQYYLYPSNVQQHSQTMLENIIHTELRCVSPDEVSFNQLVSKSPDGHEGREAVVLSYCILLEHTSMLVLEKFRALIHFRYIRDNRKSTDLQYNKILDIANHRKSVISDKMKAVLEKSVAIVQNLLKGATKHAKKSKKVFKKLEIMKSCLLGNFALDVYRHNSANERSDKISMESNVENFCTETDMSQVLSEISTSLKNERDINVANSKLQLILLSFELQLYFKNGNSEFADVGTKLCNSRSDVVKALIQLYAPDHVKITPPMKFLIDRAIFVHLSLISDMDEYQDVFTSSLQLLKTATDTSIVTSQLSFVHLLVACQRYRQGKMKSMDKKFSQPKYFRSTLDVAVCLVEKFAMRETDQSNVATLTLLLSTISDILSLGPKVIEPHDVTLAYSALLRIDLDDVLTKYSKGFSDIFSAVYSVAREILFCHKVVVINTIPHILSVCRQLLLATLHAGRQNSEKKIEDQSTIMDVKDCSSQFEKLCQLITSRYGAYFKKCVSYVIADYITGITQETIYPAIKKDLQSAMYELTSLCEDYDVAMLRTTLPPGDRDVFRRFHGDYVKHFKYSGRV